MPRFETEITAPLPDRWSAVETVTLTHPDGLANVIISVEPVGSELSTEEYAKAQGDLISNQFPEYEEIESAQVDWMGGRQAFRRTFQWQPEGRDPVTQIQLYLVDNERGYTATATSSLADFTTLQPELMLVLSGLLRRG